MLNKVILMGRLTRDPELRHTQSGTPVASFSLAVERDFASKENNEKSTDFIDIVAWRNTAEFVSKYFLRGQLVAVTGRLQIRDWKDKDGNNRRSAEVICENAYFAESKKGSRDQTGPSGDSDPETNQPPINYNFVELDEEDGELPF